jgi:hypothetical protein
MKAQNIMCIMAVVSDMYSHPTNTQIVHLPVKVGAESHQLLCNRNTFKVYAGGVMIIVVPTDGDVGLVDIKPIVPFLDEMNELSDRITDFNYEEFNLSEQIRQLGHLKNKNIYPLYQQIRQLSNPNRNCIQNSYECPLPT